MLRYFTVCLFFFGVLNGTRSQEPESVPVVNLEKLNTPADEDDPYITSDNLTLLYASNAQGTFDVMVARRSTASQPWTAGKTVYGLGSKDADERSPFLFRGTLFFATNQVPDEKFKDRKNYDIQQRTGDRAPLILPGISEPEDEMHPWITPAGREFYFSRKTKDGWQLFVADGPVPGPIGKARLVGLPTGYHHASLSSSGLTMFLQGPLEENRWGLFRSKRAKVGGPWSQPEPLIQLNHPKATRGDMSPCLNADGSRLYFASDRPGGKGGLDLWFVLTSKLK